MLSLRAPDALPHAAQRSSQRSCQITKRPSCAPRWACCILGPGISRRGGGAACERPQARGGGARASGAPRRLHPRQAHSGARQGPARAAAGTMAPQAAQPGPMRLGGAQAQSSAPAAAQPPRLAAHRSRPRTRATPPAATGAPAGAPTHHMCGSLAAQSRHGRARLPARRASARASACSACCCGCAHRHSSERACSGLPAPERHLCLSAPRGASMNDAQARRAPSRQLGAADAGSGSCARADAHSAPAPCARHACRACARTPRTAAGTSARGPRRTAGAGAAAPARGCAAGASSAGSARRASAPQPPRSSRCSASAPRRTSCRQGRVALL